ncbi:MAG: DEAD/DEAH box helicase [bacterium]|nr:DEAD/DEAH box helicase [Acidimicrobiia bacterium]MCY4650518.1 DEAD/DEAH box helicase [bacterium]
MSSDFKPSLSSVRNTSDPKHVFPEPATVVSQARKTRLLANELLHALKSAEAEAVEAYSQEQERAVRQHLSEMPLEEVKRVTRGSLRLGAVKSSGIRTVGAAKAAGRQRLESIRGVGPHTSTEILHAARQIEAIIREDNVVRLDVEQRLPTQNALLSKLHALEHARRHIQPLRPQLSDLVRAISADINLARLEIRRILRFFAGKKKRAKARAAFGRLARLLSDPTTDALVAKITAAIDRVASLPVKPTAIWEDYMSRPVPYNGLLTEIGGLDPEEAASQGFLPEDIVHRVNNSDLNTTLLHASLRGYQSFGSRYALVQESVILGDEMGLGKTIEALAVICHLRAQGATHFFVVSPASVLANWEHEIRRHTRIDRVWRLHGIDKDRSLRGWSLQGGIAITTFATLSSLDLPDIEVAAVVIDEAHYVKNPQAKRTGAVRSLLVKSQHKLLMSGTPMENRVEEFRELVNHIRPDIARGIGSAAGVNGAIAFRKAVAPVYLRRNQDDVLKELPEKIEVEEWLRLDGPAADSYRRAVASGNFMAMRRAAFLTERPSDSPKLSRMVEIATEAMDNNRKVVVFSFFRDVLDRAHQAFGSRAFGPLTGSVPAPKRQVLLDEFSRSPEPGVLVSQIEAGGVGLNIQAASVVILAEPQWKPSTEVQAIARCYRMGQVRPVEVHRLLTQNSVDEHMRDILSRKSALFAEYAQKSAIKEAAPEAIDTTAEESTQTGSSQAEQERRIVEYERHRLGIPT